LIDVTWDVLLVLLIPCKTLRLTGVGARPGHPISRHRHRYSITSSARASKVGGTVRPSALAVLRLSAKSYLVGHWQLAGQFADFRSDALDVREVAFAPILHYNHR
jgi:hypothetical protein